MRRGKRFLSQKKYSKNLLFTSGIIIAITVLTFIIIYIIYNNRLKQLNDSLLSTDMLATLVPDITQSEEIHDEVEEASSSVGRSIDEVIENIEEDIREQKEENISNQSNEMKQTENEQISKEENVETVVILDPEFSIPVDGEIMRGFAKDSLIYSQTLEEWITHLGIDIKAERTSIVKAAEKGTIIAIKNDPRYGLTIIIEHVNGFKTVYSNLLTSEFVKEGEVVEKGQSIGTVGNSSAFEIMDEPHLHFEILKDEVNVDPNIYLK